MVTLVHAESLGSVLTVHELSVAEPVVEIAAPRPQNIRNEPHAADYRRPVGPPHCAAKNRVWRHNVPWLNNHSADRGAQACVCDGLGRAPAEGRNALPIRSIALERSIHK
jgi:hypothetical protein